MTGRALAKMQNPYQHEQTPGPGSQFQIDGANALLKLRVA